MENKKHVIHEFLPGGKSNRIEKLESELSPEEIELFTGKLIHTFNISPEASKKVLIDQIISSAIENKPEFRYIDPIDDISLIEKIATENMKGSGFVRIEKLSPEELKIKYGDYLK